MNFIPDQKSYSDKFQPCMEMGAIMAATMVKNSVVVNHGASGCAISATHFRSNNVPNGTYVPIVHTAVHQNDIISGGSNKLKNTLEHVIKKAGKTPPELIWVFTSCATSMVQDDIVGISKVVEKESGIKIIPIDTPGFLGGLSVGADHVYRALIDNFASKDSKKSDKKINIIGPHMMGTKNMIEDMREIIRLLEALDIEVNTVLTYNTAIEDIRRFGEASTNYVLTPEVLSNFEEISEEFGIEIFGHDLVLPIGIANTEEWYLKIAERFGNVEKAKKQLKEDMEVVRRRIGLDYNASWILHDIANKHVGILGYAPFAAAIARYLFFDLNARPTVIGLWGESERAIESAKKLLEEMADFLDFDVYENPSFYEYGMAVQKAKVDFSIGQRNDKPLIEGLRIPQVPIGGFHYMNQFNFVPWPYFGILGSLNLLSEIARGVEEVKFERGGWISRSFIKEEEGLKKCGSYCNV
jgi:nitrogenase molybdenum-iron protein alpha/beta subunit